MRSVRGIAISLAIVVFCVIAGSLLNNAPVQASNPLAVSVTNTPLPIQGSVNIGNSPMVTVANPSIPITGNVGITNTVSVAPLGQPTTDWCEPEPGSDTCSFKAVASGMRLVIQEVDMYVVAQPRDNVYGAQLETTLNGGVTDHEFALTSQGPDVVGNPTWALHQQTTLYADAQTQPNCQVTDSTANSAFLRCTYSGYLVPVQ